jgi:hypothetical protein
MGDPSRKLFKLVEALDVATGEKALHVVAARRTRRRQEITEFMLIGLLWFQKR